MRTKIILLIGTFFMALFTDESALAGSMRCGVHLITDGGRHPPGRYEIFKKCGEPTYRDGNVWVYELRTKNTRLLRFNDGGKLVSIK